MSLKVSLAARWYMIEEGSGKRSRGGEGASQLETNADRLPLSKPERDQGLRGLPEEPTKIKTNFSGELLNPKELERIFSITFQRCISMTT